MFEERNRRDEPLLITILHTRIKAKEVLQQITEENKKDRNKKLQHLIEARFASSATGLIWLYI